MLVFNSKDVLDKEKRMEIARQLVALDKNIIVFGLHNSGKSTLVKAVCGADKRFKTLDEEEVLTDKDGSRLLRKSERLWCVGHQYPSQRQDVSENYLAGFVEGMRLNPKKWFIVKILK